MAKRKNKPIVELDKDGKIIRYWNSAREASNFHGINVVNISLNITGKTKQAKGKYFRLAKEAEIKAYSEVEKTLASHIEEKNPPAEQQVTTPVVTAEIIPESITKPDESLTPFEKLLQKKLGKIQ